MVEGAGSWELGVIIDVVKNGSAFIYTVDLDGDGEFTQKYTDYKMGVHMIHTLNDKDRLKPFVETVVEEESNESEQRRMRRSLVCESLPVV